MPRMWPQGLALEVKDELSAVRDYAPLGCRRSLAQFVPFGVGSWSSGRYSIVGGPFMPGAVEGRFQRSRYVCTRMREIFRVQEDASDDTAPLPGIFCGGKAGACFRLSIPREPLAAYPTRLYSSIVEPAAGAGP